MTITPGRIVLYRLSAEDAAAINRRRTDGASIADRIKAKLWPTGAQAHIGNPAAEGQVLAAIAVACFGSEPSWPTNLQVFLDGCDVYWATSRHEGTAPGTWSWPVIE